MPFKIIKEKWANPILKMKIGHDEKYVQVGGETSLPFLHFEGEMTHKPLVALEVWDVKPHDWPAALTENYGLGLEDPVVWARKCLDSGADLICLRLMSSHPDYDGASPAKVAATARSFVDVMDVPLIVVGCGVEEIDAAILPAVAEALSGRNALIGCATANNYKPIALSCLEHNHNIIATSPMDINLAKQLNILINETGVPLYKIAIDPLVGPLGYGIEYGYSIMERLRLGALSGDEMVAMPVICFVGAEVWRTRETNIGDSQEWGGQFNRATLWEMVTASTLAQAGGSIFIMRHSYSARCFQKHIDALMKPYNY